MKVKYLIELLEEYPKKLPVTMIELGEGGLQLASVWRARNGFVLISPSRRMVEDFSLRPYNAPITEYSEWEVPGKGSLTASKLIARLKRYDGETPAALYPSDDDPKILYKVIWYVYLSRKNEVVLAGRSEPVCDPIHQPANLPPHETSDDDFDVWTTSRLGST